MVDNIPDWLLLRDSYVPKKERDAFINKSILSIVRGIVKLRLQLQYKKNIFGLNTSTKVIALMLLLLLLSLSRSPAFILIIGTMLLFITSFLRASEIRYIGKMSFIASIFTLIILIPAILFGNKNNSILMVIKVFESAAMISLVSVTTPWNDITETLKIFHIPDIFIFVLDITMKYALIFGEFALDMLYSLKLRSVGKNKNRNKSLSGIIGTLFLKSRDMAEDMHGAMECRGFVGEYKILTKEKLGIRDAVCYMMLLTIIFIYFYFDRL